jgi:ABC-type sugar transport system ATPase subunit
MRLKDRGYGLVLISHNLADIFEVADRIVVLRLGRNAGIFDAKKDSSEDVVAAITGASDSAALQRERARIGRSGGDEQTRSGGEVGQ